MKENIYNVNLKIDVDKQNIESEAKLIFYMNNKLSSLNFYIHNNLEIDFIKCNKNITYKVGKEIANWSPFILESKLINIKFQEDINENNLVNLDFKYKGKIDIVSEYGINRISKDFVELGLYSPWFPLFEDYRKCNFNVNINITEGYKVLNAERVKDIFVIKNDVPDNDCTIIASNKFKEFRLNTGDTDIAIYYLEDSQKDITYKLFSNVSKIMKLYKNFGKINSKMLSIVNLPRENGGGYCRDNLIVLNLNNEESDIDTFRFIAHELAHLWWHGASASSFEDWLNESFAEFSALLAVKKVYGEEEFIKRIKLYEEESKDLKPIINLNRQDENAYVVLYRKGPVILNKLMNNIGEERFIEILRKRLINNVNTTNELLKLIEDVTTEKIKDKFEETLNK